MQLHKLKCDWEPLTAIQRNEKTSEFRKNDRDFKKGDLLELESEIPNDMRLGSMKLAAVLCRVSHVQPGGTYGIPEDYAVLSIEVISIVNREEYFRLLPD